MGSQSFVNELISRRNQEMREQKSNQKNKNNDNKQSSFMKLNASNNPSIALQKKYDALKSAKHSKAKQPLTSTYKQGGAMTINYAPISKSKSKSKANKKQQRKERKRTMCGCQATLHDVFKNCTKCGNILCMIEGEGPCFFCSAYVTLAGTVSSSVGVGDTAAPPHINSEDYKKAVAQKDKLLRF